jgi:NADH-quinone oxidoreductase subunit A
MIVASVASAWGILVFFILALLITFSIVGLAYVLGQRHRGPSTAERYESGLPMAGGLPHRFSIEFYLVAMIFVVFDLEAVFIFAWAVALRALGWTGFVEALVFIVLLLAALAYVWLTGALDWGTSGRQKRQRSCRP